MEELTVVLPAYNEEMTIEATILAFFKELPNARFVVINNNSLDQTRELAERTFTKHGIRGLIVDEFRQGKGNAVRAGFNCSDSDFYILVDADSTYPANQVQELLKYARDGSADMVVGNRLSGGLYKRENKRLFHNFGNNLVRYLINKLFNANITDVMSGYRVLSNEFVKNYPLLVNGFEIETDMTLHALDLKYRIVEVPIQYKDRPLGSFSKLNTFRDGLRVIKLIFVIFSHFRPLQFFTLIAIAFLLLGLICSLPVLNDWVEYKYVYHLPLAILSVGFEMCAIITFSIGLILNSISYHQRNIRELIRMNRKIK
jgi:glycosyltransferase involved in cell wall biosynthesis